MNKTWYIEGDDAGGLTEDSVQLYVGDKGKMLVFVVDGRDVDAQFSIPDGLYQHHFEPLEPAIKITSIKEFQDLVNQQFGEHPNTKDIEGWFRLGKGDWLT